MSDFDPQSDDTEAQRRALLNLSSQGSIVPAAPKYKDQLPSQTESFLRGGSQGATLGWGDEASGALGAAFPTETDIALNRSYPERYQAIKSDIQKSNLEAQQANPKTYMGGEIAGGLATAGATPSLAGGGALANTAKVAGTLAGYGAAQGSGEAPEGQKLQGAYEGAKGAVKAPFELAAATGEKLAQGNLTGAGGTGALMALSILPFALEGRPINKFVIDRAEKNIGGLAQNAYKAINTGTPDDAVKILDTLRQHQSDAEKAVNIFQQKKQTTGSWVNDTSNPHNQDLNSQIMQANRVYRNAKQEADLLEDRLAQHKENIQKQIASDESDMSFTPEESNQINENMKAGRSAFQNKEYTPQQHAQDIYTNSIDSLNPDQELIDSVNHLNELSQSDPKYQATVQHLQNLINQRQSTRTVIPSDIFQAKLNALRKLQGK